MSTADPGWRNPRVMIDLLLRVPPLKPTMGFISRGPTANSPLLFWTVNRRMFVPHFWRVAPRIASRAKISGWHPCNPLNHYHHYQGRLSGSDFCPDRRHLQLCSPVLSVWLRSKPPVPMDDDHVPHFYKWECHIGTFFHIGHILDHDGKNCGSVKMFNATIGIVVELFIQGHCWVGL